MTDRAQQLLRQALTLPVNERADVAAELLASLDEASAQNPAEVEAAWAHEIERRARLSCPVNQLANPGTTFARITRRLAER
jgi:hypothetical protein